MAKKTNKKTNIVKNAVCIDGLSTETLDALNLYQVKYEPVEKVQRHIRVSRSDIGGGSLCGTIDDFKADIKFIEQRLDVAARKGWNTKVYSEFSSDKRKHINKIKKMLGIDD